MIFFVQITYLSEGMFIDAFIMELSVGNFLRIFDRKETEIHAKVRMRERR